jgi:hypothetical protein
LVANDRYDAICGGGWGRNMIVHFSLVVVFGAMAASGLTLQALQSFFGWSWRFSRRLLTYWNPAGASVANRRERLAGRSPQNSGGSGSDRAASVASASTPLHALTMLRRRPYKRRNGEIAEGSQSAFNQAI